VQQGETIALLNGKLVYSASEIEDALIHLLEAAHTEDYERITLFYGLDVSKKEVDELAEEVRKIYPSHEIEIHEGGQPHYYYIVSIE